MGGGFFVRMVLFQVLLVSPELSLVPFNVPPVCDPVPQFAMQDNPVMIQLGFGVLGLVASGAVLLDGLVVGVQGAFNGGAVLFDLLGVLFGVLEVFPDIGFQARDVLAVLVGVQVRFVLGKLPGVRLK